MPAPARTGVQRPATSRSSRSPRWDLMGRYQVRVGGELFIDRLRVIQCPLFAVLLTRIYGPDDGRDPHGHSRPFATFILSGSYTERVWPYPDQMRPHGENPPGCSGWASDLLRDGIGREHRRFSLRFMPATWAHEITGVKGPLRTLVIAGRHRGTWFFWTPDGPVDWRDYG